MVRRDLRRAPPNAAPKTAWRGVMQIDGPVVALIVAHASTQVGAVIHAQPVATLEVATPHTEGIRT